MRFETLKSFFMPWIYAGLLFMAGQVAIAVGALFNLQFEIERTLCSVQGERPVQHLLDEHLARYPGVTARLHPLDTDWCDGFTARVNFSYRDHLLGHISKLRSFEALADEKEIRLRGLNFYHEPDYTATPLAAAMFASILALFFLFRQRRRGRYVTPPTMKRTWIIYLLYGVLAGALLFVLVQAVFYLVKDHIRIPSWGLWTPEHVQLSAVMLLIVAVLIPVFEEIVFRAWLLEAWRKVIGPAASLLLTSAVFSLAHPMGVTANLVFLIPGLILGWLWLRTRSLTACCVAHGTYNAIGLFVLAA